MGWKVEQGKEFIDFTAGLQDLAYVGSPHPRTEM